MNTSHLIPTLALGLATIAPALSAQDAAPVTPPPAAAPAVAPEAVTVPAAVMPANPAPVPIAAYPSSDTRGAGGIRFNFRGAPLEAVLNYLSDAAGFVIVLDTPVRGTVDMWSSQPVSKQEAVQLLNVAINKYGYSATAQGRSLVISSKDDAKKRNLAIRTGNDSEEIPSNAEMVMQIIPLRRIDATQASRDLGTLLPGSAAITANQDSNSLIVTDTNINLKHIVELVNALDTSVETVTTVRIFRLKNADPAEMAQLLTNLFGTTQNTNRTGQTNAGGQGGFAFGPGGAGGPGGFGAMAAMANAMGGNRGNRNSSTTTSRTVPVLAVADPRTYSVVVTASKEAMPNIAEMVGQLDSSPARKQKVFVYTLANANVKQVETVLKNLFQSSSRSSSSNSQPDPLTSRATTNASSSNNSSTLSLGSSSSSRSN